MNEKILIKMHQKNHLFDAIIQYMKSEKMDYNVQDSLDHISKEITKIIFIDEKDSDSIHFSLNNKVSMIMICDQKKLIQHCSNVNYIITDLIHDDNDYTDVQKEYLFKNGIYHVFIEKLDELLNSNHTTFGMIYDLTNIKSNPEQWIFHFDSINDTYSWLLKKNRKLPNDFVRKIINFYSDKVYDDSLREINYLTDKLKEIKEGKKIVDIFICTKEELEQFKKNYFFKLLIKNISATYKIFFINKEVALENDHEIISKLMDGIVIYDDCIYRDTYDNEFSLGFVDCKKKTINEYNEYFDDILEKYGKEIKTERDVDEFQE